VNNNCFYYCLYIMLLYIMLMMIFLPDSVWTSYILKEEEDIYESG
jgi:hypothetical protein